ncbi:MAG TPA: diheme cytochrome c-553 [Chryseolinea sp.]
MKNLNSLSLILGVFTAIVSSCSGPLADEKEMSNDNKEELIKRGKYLVTIGACHDCHSPKIFTPEGFDIDTTRILSGHPANDEIPKTLNTKDWVLFSNDLTAFVGPWGVSFSANLTPDDTGIGNWTFDQFRRAIRKGLYKGLEGSRALRPPMPWQMYKTMTDDDLNAVFTYLKSIKPVQNLVPPPISPTDLNK